MVQVSEGGRFLTQGVLRPLSRPPFGWAGGPLGELRYTPPGTEGWLLLRLLASFSRPGWNFPVF